jgi:NAD(P)-dependent dehydrogenase (short-subunit alcohol dehydrogenase family)
MPFVLVTGASQGIGAAIALEFARATGASLALVSRNPATLKTVADQCRELGGDPRFFQCDLTQERDVEATMTSIVSQIGVPDVVVNNAGQFKPGSVQETTPSDFQKQIAANLMTAYNLTHAVINPMMARGSGHIFFMASVASIRGYPSGAAYCAAKHGLLGLARALREETKESGLKVTSVIPGATYTASWADSGVPESRFMPPEDVARTVVDIYKLGDRSVVEEIVIRPQLGDL